MEITKEEMQKGYNKKSTIWMKFAKTNAKKYPSYLHIFYEGEDGSYYVERINQYSEYKLEELINYDCKGKDNVTLLWRKISSDKNYKNINTRFFVDKDYGLDSDEFNEDVYQTYMYSFENYYTSMNCYKKILINEYKVNATDEEFLYFLEMYQKRLKEYKEILANFNAFITCFHKVKSPIKIDRCKLDDFFTIQIDKISVFKEMNFVNLKEYYESKLKSDLINNKNYAEENLRKFTEVIDLVETIYPEELINIMDSLDTLSHGKLEFYFLKKFLEALKKANTDKVGFKERRTSVHIDPQSKGLISYLSKYADTPVCLIEFIKTINEFKKNTTVNEPMAI